MKTPLHLLLLIWAIIISGCASQPGISPALQTPTASSSWQLNGKLGFRSPQDKFTANLFWKQCNNNYSIRLSGPFGRGAVQLKGHNTQVEIQLSDGQVHQAETPEALMEKLIGWSLPITELRYWIRGEAAPNQAYSAEHNGKTYSTLSQRGWTIDYLAAFAANTQTPALPKKLKMQRDAIKATLINHRWQALDSDACITKPDES